jgi:hypothetical protein
MDSNELLRIIGKLYVDLYQMQALLQQAQQNLTAKQEEISALQRQLTQAQQNDTGSA